jgi:YD repeat-containing protein
MHAPPRHQRGRRIVCAAALVLSACATAHHHPALPRSVNNATPPIRHDLWRPLHKGHADLSSGVYIRVDDDLVINAPLPIVLRRTYNSGDQHSRHFGMDATHPGEWWIHGNSDPRVPWGELILADGGRIRFTRISPGETRVGAILRHDSTPTQFNGALLRWAGSKWEMQLADGSTASFLDCRGRPYVCSLIERRDSDGHRVQYVRDSAGVLQKMESEEQSIAFEYDDHKRIARAYDTLGREVRYTYDDGGCLIRVESSNDVTREYRYDARNHLTRVQEPGRIVDNWFDDAGRWARQTVKSSEDDNDPYVATAHYVVKDGSIVEASFDEGGGLQVYKFNAHHYVTSETFYADSPHPVVFAYDVDPVTSVSHGATMSCKGPSGPVARSAQLSVHDDATKAAMIQSFCLPRH